MTEHPDYRTYHQHTRVPEELFFHSILAGTDFAYEVVNDCLRFNAWDGMRARVLTMTYPRCLKATSCSRASSMVT